jgi:hypothetical protein
MVRSRTPIEPIQTLKIEVHRVGVRSFFRASRLGGDELGVQRVRQTRDDLILHVEEIGKLLIEPLGLVGFAQVSWGLRGQGVINLPPFVPPHQSTSQRHISTPTAIGSRLHLNSSQRRRSASHAANASGLA